VNISDYLVVGSGLTGAVIARALADAGRTVLVIERRTHLGGNVHDYTHESGIRIHSYGPHYFRTNSDKLWRFVNRFGDFRRFEANLKTYVDGNYENWPIAGSYIRRTVGSGWKPAFSGVPANFEQASLSMMPRLIYEKFVKGYTEKQWGVPARTLSADLAKRFDVRGDDESRLMRHKFQGLPEKGYANFMTKLLEGIPVILNCDYHKRRGAFIASRMTIFTGPIDEYFAFDIGRLKYRGQKREHEYLPHTTWAQPCIQVNNPDPTNGSHIRTLEWKHLLTPDEAGKIGGTVLTRETTVSPSNPNDYEYPFPDDKNARLYKRYAERAESISGLLICGRLGEYRYYDMDQAIARAQVLAQRILDEAGFRQTVRARVANR
jgi:UDP-galactopyranose mutase